MSSYKNKLIPPKRIQRMLLDKGYVFQLAVHDDEALWEEHLRYQKWCRSVAKSIERRITLKRKSIRKGKRVFAYDCMELFPKRSVAECEATE